jgi:hypothetical protein
MINEQILPGTGRWLAAGQTEGAIPQRCAAPIAPSTACGGPPPRAGEELA